MALSDLFSKYKKYIAGVVVGFLVINRWDYVAENWEYWITPTEQTEQTPPPTTSTIEQDAVVPTTTQTDKEPATPIPTPKDESPVDRVNQVKVVTWNLYNIGISKDDEEVEFIAKLLKNYDIIAVQEVSTKISGPRAITKLNEELSRRGSKWEYVISDPTSGPGSERYAYLWKTKRVKLSGRPWLVKAKDLDDKINREPYMARFEVDGHKILMANFHAVPSSKDPENEIVLLDELHNSYRNDNLTIMGDFNLSQKHEAFDNIKRKGYRPVLINQKTSLKTKIKDGNYLAQEYDNLFYENRAFVNKRSGIIDFVKSFDNDLKAARNISDHLPVWCELTWK